MHRSALAPPSFLAAAFLALAAATSLPAAAHGQAASDNAGEDVPRQLPAGAPADEPDETSGAFVLGPEDVVQVFVWKEDELSTTATVRPDGRITLLGRRSLIDDRLYAAVPLVNGFRPVGNRGDFQAIESCRTVVALFDVDAEHGTTVAIRGQRVELAGTTIRAIAVNEFASFQ